MKCAITNHLKNFFKTAYQGKEQSSSKNQIRPRLQLCQGPRLDKEKEWISKNNWIKSFLIKTNPNHNKLLQTISDHTKSYHTKTYQTMEYGVF